LALAWFADIEHAKIKPASRTRVDRRCICPTLRRANGAILNGASHECNKVQCGSARYVVLNTHDRRAGSGTLVYCIAQVRAG
jgi:hypothetical protein